jgi:hypothetical protein
MRDAGVQTQSGGEGREQSSGVATLAHPRKGGLNSILRRFTSLQLWMYIL